MNNNIISTTVVSLIVAFFFGLIFNAIYIAPVVVAATTEAAEAAAPMKINAKKAILLYESIATVEKDKANISKCFATTLNDGGFEINNQLTLSVDEIKIDLDEIKSMVKQGDYIKASDALKEYKNKLKAQVRWCYSLLPMGHMFMMLVNADKLGIEWYFEK